MRNMIRVMMMFIWRDWLVYRPMAMTLFINYGIISPVVYTYAYGYIIPRLGIQSVTDQSATIFFAGSILTVLFPLAFTWHKELLQDLESTRFIAYQLSVLSPYMVMFERIVFGSWVVMIHAIPYFIMAVWLLGSKLVLTNLSLWRFMLCLYGGAFVCSAFVMMLVCFVQDFRSVRNFWLRVNHPMLQMGGLFMPWYIMNETSRLLGIITLVNPMLYITEGLKQSLMNDPRFFSFIYSITGISVFTIIFYRMALHYLRRKLDYVHC